MCCMAPAITCRCWGWGKHEVRCGGGRRSVTTVGEIILSDETGFPWNKAKLVESGVRHLRPFNISNDGQLDLAQTYFVPVEAATEAKASLVAGDVLFNNTNSVELVGKSALVLSDTKAAFSNHITRIRVNASTVSPAYFNYWLRFEQAKGTFAAAATQWVSQAAFRASDMKRLEIPLPPLEEQHRIVDLLSRAEGIVRLRREAQRKAAELLPTLFLDIFGDPASNPKGWPVVRIGDLGRVQLGRQRAPKYQTGKFTCPYVRVANVFEDRIDTNDLLSMDFDARDFTKYRLDYGDILLNEGQSIELVGRPAMWRNEVEDCCFQNTLVRFQPNKEMLLPEFALAAMLNYYRSGALSKISSKTSNVAHLGASRFANMTLFTPPIALQRQFAAKADAIRAIAAQQTTALATAQATFDALLHQAFSRTRMMDK